MIGTFLIKLLTILRDEGRESSEIVEAHVPLVEFHRRIAKSLQSDILAAISQVQTCRTLRAPTRWIDLTWSAEHTPPASRDIPPFLKFFFVFFFFSSSVVTNSLIIVPYHISDEF